MLKADGFSAVIFDMDGLVLDTESTYCIAWQQAAAAMGYQFTDSFCQSLSGLNYKDLELKLLANYGCDFNLPEFNRHAGQFWRGHVHQEGIEIKPGFHNLLAFITKNKIPFCLATNSHRVNAHECLELSGLKNVFEVIVCRDDVGYGKPEPDIYLKAATLLKIPANKCLVLEDSHVGIVAAHKAGSFSVFIPSTPVIDPATLELCNLMMADLDEVLQAIRNQDISGVYKH